MSISSTNQHHQRDATLQPKLLSETLYYKFEAGIFSVSSSGATSQIAIYNRAGTLISTKLFPYSTEDRMLCRQYVKSLTSSEFFREWHILVIQSQDGTNYEFTISYRNPDSVEIKSASGKRYVNFSISDTASIRRYCMYQVTSI